MAALPAWQMVAQSRSRSMTGVRFSNWSMLSTPEPRQAMSRKMKQ